jgi:hypothetical protein
MNNTQKTILLLGLLQYETELLEELIEDKYLSSTFTHGLRKASNDFRKYSDRIISAVCSQNNEQVNKEVYDVYRVVSDLMSEIKWKEIQKEND